MAVVDLAYEIEFYIEDAKGKNSIIPVFVGTVGGGELSISQLIDTAIALRGYLQPLVGGHIRRASVKLYLGEFAGSPAPDSNISAGVLFILSDGTAYRELLFLPARNDAIIAQTYEYVPPGTVDFSLPDVANFANMVYTGFVVAGETWKVADSKGDVIPFIAGGAVCYTGIRSTRRR